MAGVLGLGRAATRAWLRGAGRAGPAGRARPRGAGGARGLYAGAPAGQHWLTETQSDIRELALDFARNELAPHAAKWDAEKVFPVDALRHAASLGFGAIYSSEEFGGAGLGRRDAAVVFEALAYGDVSTAAYVTIHNMNCFLLDTFGSPEQKERWLPRLASMELLSSYCLTEPGSGSDAASLSTQARRDGDDYVLSGSKAFISGAGAADVYFIMARTGEPGSGPGGITCFLVEKGAEGLSFGAPEHKLGWNSQPTAIVNLDGVRVPAAQRVGEEGQGFKIAMRGLDGGRINIAACSLGGAQFCLETAQEYVASRKQFGKPLGALQATQFKLADMATDLRASRLMVHSAADALDNKLPSATGAAAMAKRFATDTCFSVVDRALQLHGGYGYLRDYPIERYLRDLRVHSILEGTNEIMRVIAAREMQRGNIA